MNKLLVSFLIVFILSATVIGAPVNKADAQLKVTEESNDFKSPEFNWSYELSDGRLVRQNAYVKKLDDGTEVLVINGLYSYIAPDGVKYTVSYYSDEDGYHPTVIVGNQPLAPEGPQDIDPKVLLSLVG